MVDNETRSWHFIFLETGSWDNKGSAKSGRNDRNSNYEVRQTTQTGQMDGHEVDLF